MVLNAFEIDAGFGLEWKLLNDYLNVWKTNNPDSLAYLNDEFYYSFDTWLAKTYKTVNRPSQDMVFRFACIEDKVEFLLRCK